MHVVVDGLMGVLQGLPDIAHRTLNLTRGISVLLTRQIPSWPDGSPAVGLDLSGIGVTVAVFSLCSTLVPQG
jgi:hypothetical protein